MSASQLLFSGLQGRDFVTELNVDPFFSNVSLLISYDNVLEDDSLLNSTITDASGSPIYVTGQFGSAVSLIKGSPNDVAFTVEYQPEYSFGSQDFTLETWLSLQVDSTSQSQTIVAKRNGNPEEFGLQVQASSGNQVRFIAWTDGDLIDITTTSGLTLDTWTHLAVTRVGDTVRIFFDGDLQETQVLLGNESIVSNTADIFFGAFEPGFSQNNITAYYDETRITTGVGRYTANFTRPEAPFLRA